MISVAIPTCNSAHTIRKALESVWAQTLQPEEVVVVDDASTDETLSVVKEYKDKVRVIPLSQNSGSADIPRYKAVEACKTPLVALLDSDDLWDVTKLEKQVAFMEQHPNVSLSHHYVRFVNEEGVPGKIRHEGTLPPTGRQGPQLLERCYICTSSVMVRRDAWLGAVDINQLEGYGTEWDIFLSLAAQGPVGLLNEVLGSYRYSSGSISRKNWKRYSRDVPGMLRIYKSGLWRPFLSRREEKNLILGACCEDADLHRYQGVPNQSLWFCRQGLRVRPLHAGMWIRTGKAVTKLLVNG